MSPISLHAQPAEPSSARPSVLVVNSGSSSLKFSLIEMASEAAVVSGLAEALETEDAVIHITRPGAAKEIHRHPDWGTRRSDGCRLKTMA